jgi:hypothetical protein
MLFCGWAIRYPGLVEVRWADARSDLEQVVVWGNYPLAEKVDDTPGALCLDKDKRLARPMRRASIPAERVVTSCSWRGVIWTVSYLFKLPTNKHLAIGSKAILLAVPPHLHKPRVPAVVIVRRIFYLLVHPAAQIAPNPLLIRG